METYLKERMGVEVYTPSFDVPTPGNVIIEKDTADLEAMIRANIAHPDSCVEGAEKRLTVTEILNDCGIENPLKSQLNEAAKIMRDMRIETIKSNGIVKRKVKLINQN